MSDRNQIERSVFIRAPRKRVWRALADIQEFCRWFQCETVEPAFRPGAHIKLRTVYPGPYYGMEFYLDMVEMVENETLSWRWHPGVKREGEDISGDPPTLVTFRLEDAEGGTRVTVTESGFDQLLESRRVRAYESNQGGWQIQMAALERYAGEQG